MKDLYCKVYIVNAEKYNSGEDNGFWLELNGSINWENVFEKLELNGGEYLIVDYDSNINNIDRYLAMPSMEDMDELGDKLYDINSDEYSKKLFSACCEVGVPSFDINDIIEHYEEYTLYEDVNDDESLGYAIIENEYDDDPSNVKNADMYFDYEGFGRDESINRGGDFTEYGFLW